MNDKSPQATTELSLTPAEVLERLPAWLEARDYVVIESTPEEVTADPSVDELVTFGVKRSMFRNALIGLVLPKPQGAGSLVEIYLGTAPGESYAVLDKRRNAKTAAEIAEAMKAELS